VPLNLAPGKGFFLFFKKFLCRVSPDLAPGKGFFAGGQSGTRQIIYFLFCFFGPIFL
jgi:hypothetical protein